MFVESQANGGPPLSTRIEEPKEIMDGWMDGCGLHKLGPLDMRSLGLFRASFYVS